MSITASNITDKSAYILCEEACTLLFFMLSHSHTEKASKNNCSLGVDEVSTKE